MGTFAHARGCVHADRRQILIVSKSRLGHLPQQQDFLGAATNAQCVRIVADSHRKKSRLQRLSFAWPRKVSHEGPVQFGSCR
jgi:hypothetical protein